MSTQNPLIIIIPLILFSSLYKTHILISALDVEIEKISGEDDKNEALIILKVKALSEFINNFKRTRSHLVLSPAPAPAPAPSSTQLHRHSHHAPHAPPRRSSHVSPKPENGGGENAGHDRVIKRILVPVFISVTVCVFAAVCGLVVLICFCKKKRNKSKNVYSKKVRRGKSKNVNSSSKVSLNPGLNLFYLSTLELDLEQPNNNPIPNGMIENEEQNQECVESESDNVKSIEIQDGKYESGDKIIPIECNLSSSDDDDDSFHSFNDSHSPVGPRQLTCSLECENNFTFTPPTPPPPPPPPPPHMASRKRILAPNYKITNVASSSTLSNSPPLKNSTSSVCIPPPPCPPPMGKDGSSLPKLKPLHWDKVRAAPDRSMVWDKLRTSSFEFDEEMIESLFGYNMKSSMKNDGTKSKSPSPTKHVLESKRLQNITILSKALNASCEQVCAALMKGEGLGLQQLEALAKMVLTKEEEGKLCSYKGDIDNLGSAERFVKALLGIPLAFQRVEAMLYRETFEDETVHLRNSFSMLEEACKELKSSRLFLKLLEAVLKTGNRMNVGTIRGGAKAFKLDALLKLADVKGTDGKTSLLHFVVQEIIRSEGIRVSDSIMGQINQKSRKPNKTAEEKEEHYKKMGLDLVSGLSTEFYNVKKTATIDIEVLGSSVSNLSEGLVKLKNLVQKELSDGNFAQSMKCFVNYAERNLRQLREDEKRVWSNVKEITEYFHGNVVSKDREANPLRIFVIVRDFLATLDHVCKELRNVKAPNSPNPLAPFS